MQVMLSVAKFRMNKKIITLMRKNHRKGNNNNNRIRPQVQEEVVRINKQENKLQTKIRLILLKKKMKIIMMEKK